MPELKGLIISRTGGNPLFMEEFTHSLIENGSIQRQDNKFVLNKKLSDVEIPNTIQGIITARMDRLEDNLKRTIQIASVIGKDFAFRILQLITGMREELKSHLLNLQGLELIYEKSLFPELEYIFKHALIQEVSYNSLLLKRRKEIHKKIGRAIEQIYPERLEEFYEMLAYHCYEGEDWEKALEYLAKTGDKLTTARRLGDRHLEGTALAYRGRAEHHNHEVPTSEETLKAALAIADEGFEDVRFFASVTLGVHFLLYNRHTEAEPLRLAAEKPASEVDDPFILGWWSVYGSLWHYWEGRFNDALKFQARWHDAIKRGGVTYLINSWVEALARGGKGEYEKALTLLEDMLGTAERMGDIYWLARALNTMGWLYGELQDHRQAMEWNMRGVKVAREAAVPNLEGESNARLNLGDNLLSLGRLDEAEEQFQKVEQVVRNPRPQDLWMLWRYSQHLFHSYGEIWIARGNLDKSITFTDECLALALQSNSQKNIVKGSRLRAQVFLAQGKQAEADQELSIALEIAHRVGNPTQLWKTYAVVGDLRQAQGRPDEASRAYTAALSIIKEIAGGLHNESLRDTFISSPPVQEIHQKAQRRSGS